MSREVESSDVKTEEWEHPSGKKKGEHKFIFSKAHKTRKKNCKSKLSQFESSGFQFDKKLWNVNIRLNIKYLFFFK